MSSQFKRKCSLLCTKIWCSANYSGTTGRPQGTLHKDKKCQTANGRVPDGDSIHIMLHDVSMNHGPNRALDLDHEDAIQSSRCLRCHQHRDGRRAHLKTCYGLGWPEAEQREVEDIGTQTSCENLATARVGLCTSSWQDPVRMSIPQKGTPRRSEYPRTSRQYFKEPASGSYIQAQILLTHDDPQVCTGRRP